MLYGKNPKKIRRSSNAGAFVALGLCILFLLGAVGFLVAQVAEVGPQHEQMFGNREFKITKAYKPAEVTPESAEKA